MAATESIPRSMAKGRVFPLPSARHLLVIGLAVAAAIANFVVLSSADRSVDVLVVAADTPAGTRVDAATFTVAKVAAGSALVDRLIDGESAAGLIGTVTVRPLTAGDPVLPGDLLAADAHGLRSMSLPVGRDAAVGGSLRVGDRVDVLVVHEGVGRYLAVDLEVVAIPPPDSLSSNSFAPTVAVDAETAPQLAAALESGAVHIVRSTGATPVTPGGVDG